MAERAIRQLAVQRKISGTFFKRAAPHYRLLLAISQTDCSWPFSWKFHLACRKLSCPKNRSQPSSTLRELAHVPTAGIDADPYRLHENAAAVPPRRLDEIQARQQEIANEREHRDIQAPRSMSPQ